MRPVRRACFVLAMTADWRDLDVEECDIVFEMVKPQEPFVKCYHRLPPMDGQSPFRPHHLVTAAPALLLTASRI